MPVNFGERNTRRFQTIDRFLKETGVTRIEQGSVAQALLDAIFAEMDSLEIGVQSELLNFNPLSAGESYAQAWADLFGIQPRLPKRAFATAFDKAVRLFVRVGTFGDLTGGSPLVLPPGSFQIYGVSRQVFNDSERSEFPLSYELVDTVTLQPADSEAWISVVASGAGSSYDVGVGALSSHDYPLEGLEVENVLPILNSENGDTPESLRYAITRSAYGRNPSAEDRILYALQRISAISDLRIRRGFSHPASIDIYIDTISFLIPDSLVQEASQAIQSLVESPEKVFVSKAPRVGLSLQADVEFKIGTSESRKDEILLGLENLCFASLSRMKLGQPMSLEDLRRDLLIGYAEVANLHDMRAWIHRDSFAGTRVYSEVSPDTYIEPELHERLFPEQVSRKPFLFRRRA